MSLYKSEYYEHRHEKTLHAAETILSIIERVVPPISSAVDVGCGVGTWLHVAEERGATEVCGIDGGWVNRQHLRISEENFVEQDLGEDTDVKLGRTFDLAISLEVAEHLPATSAGGLVDLLTTLSDFVLFSAAIPYQQGVGHVNEQWPPYWMSLFESRGFVGVDIVRKLIWNDKTIPWWYRQNILLFVKNERVPDLALADPLHDHIPPEQYMMSFRKAVAPGVRQAFGGLVSALAKRTTRAFKTNRRAG